MQNLPNWLLCWQWCAGLLGLGMSAAAALPLITALTLLIGRRGQARFCAFGARHLSRLGWGLAWLGPPLIVGELAALLITLRGPQEAFIRLPSPWDPALLPFSVTVLIWLAGLFCAWLLKRACTRTPLPSPASRPEDDCWEMPAIRGKLLLCLLAVACFFAACVSRNWPFAALPPGLNLTQVASAVLSTAMHTYFMALAPAGALALLMLPRARRAPGGEDFAATDYQRAARWCALWAMVGYIPFCLDRWGLILGYALRGGSPAGWLLPQVLPLMPLTVSVICWAALFAMARPLRLQWLNWLALSLLAVREGLPLLLLLAGQGR